MSERQLALWDPVGQAAPGARTRSFAGSAWNTLSGRSQYSRRLKWSGELSSGNGLAESPGSYQTSPTLGMSL